MSKNAVIFKSQTPNPNFSQVLDVSAEEVQKNLQKVKVIDVRKPDEWVGELGHIAAATLVTLDTLPFRLAEIPKDQNVVFVCKSGGRSAQATSYALENGYKTVFNMKGGMLEWNLKKFETTNTADNS